MSRGVLRIYLGAAPGVGKTCAMLDEGWRRAGRGTDVVIGFVETHGRVGTLDKLRDLPCIGPKVTGHRGATMQEMDIDAVLARHPRLALVDELAHTNAPGSRFAKRWQDVDLLLDAGIDVITTVNIQHLESLNDVVARITGIRQRETVPDDFVRSAEQIELVDMTPEALRRRMAHGNVYPAERIDAALGNYFRPGNLAALRELSLLWLADRVEENLDTYVAAHDITDAWETRERVVVALSGVAGGDTLIRRGARIAGARHGALSGVHVVTSDGRAERSDDSLGAQRQLLTDVGGSYHEVVSDDIGAAIISFAHSKKATQVVIGATTRPRWSELVRGSVAQAVLRNAGTLDVHVISSNPAEPPRLRLPRTNVIGPFATIPQSPRRRNAAWALTLVGLPLLNVGLTSMRSHFTLTTATLLYLAVVIAIASLGGFLQAALAALVATLAINWYFTPPLHTLTISSTENIVALVVFLILAILVSALTQRISQRSFESRRAQSESEALARTSAVLVGDSDDVHLVIEQISQGLRLDGAALLHRSDTGWTASATAGATPPTVPEGSTCIDLNDNGTTVLALRRTGPTIDRRVLQAFADQIGVVIERQRLRVAANAADALAVTNNMRTSLLRSVSHDLRTPLTSIKAAVSTLLQRDLQLDDADINSLLESIDGSTDRLNRVIANLLDLSRLQGGPITLRLTPTAIEDVTASALDYLDVAPGSVDIELRETDPMVLSDPPLLERVLANVIANAITWSPANTAVHVDATPVGTDVQIRIVDRGPGISREQRARAFEPFQRLGDRATHTGVGLGLAVAHGFTIAMGGTIELDDTAGGGLTVIITLPRADQSPANPLPPTTAPNGTP